MRAANEDSASPTKLHWSLELGVGISSIGAVFLVIAGLRTSEPAVTTLALWILGGCAISLNGIMRWEAFRPMRLAASFILSAGLLLLLIIILVLFS